MTANLKMEPHLIEPAIILRYSEDSTNEEQFKIIQLNGLSNQSDPRAIANFIYVQCKQLIPANYLAKLEQLIIYLQKRLNTTDFFSFNSSEIFCKGDPDLPKLEEYIEMLYDEGKSKQLGVSLISRLILNLSLKELAEIVSNERLLSILQRTFREDSKHNFELAFQLCNLFYRISEFNSLHAILSQWKIGLLNFQLAEYELKRWESWKKQMSELNDENSKNKFKIAIFKQAQLITVCLQILMNLSDNFQIEAKMIQKGLMQLLFNAIEHDSPKLIFVSIKFIWKLSQVAENQQYIIHSERTIEKLILFISQSSKHIVEFDYEMRVAIFSLLFNCSFNPSNCRRMVQSGLIPILAPYLSACDITLALMYQLSTVDDGKAMIAYTDSISTLLELLFHGSSFKLNQSEKEKREILIKTILINVVLEKRNAQLLCGTDGKQLDSLIAMAIDGEIGDMLTIKIARNIAEHEGPTREMFRKWIPQLLENAIDKVFPAPSSDKIYLFGLECLAICAQITDVFWSELDRRYKLTDFLMRLLQETEKQQTFIGTENEMKRIKKCSKMIISNDLLLQIIIFCGTLSKYSIEMADIVEKKLLSLLITILNKYHNDNGIVFQCCSVFFYLLSYREIANKICETERIVEILLNLIHNNDIRIRNLADKALELVSEISTLWKNKILETKFRWNNAQWFEMVKADPSVLISNDEPLFEFNNAAIPAEIFLIGDFE